MLITLLVAGLLGRFRWKMIRIIWKIWFDEIIFGVSVTSPPAVTYNSRAVYLFIYFFTKKTPARWPPPGHRSPVQVNWNHLETLKRTCQQIGRWFLSAPIRETTNGGLESWTDEGQEATEEGSACGASSWVLETFAQPRCQYFAVCLSFEWLNSVYLLDSTRSRIQIQNCFGLKTSYDASTYLVCRNSGSC